LFLSYGKTTDGAELLNTAGSTGSSRLLHKRKGFRGC
jgi:hypothetical protein